MKKYRKAATGLLKGSLMTGVGASAVTQAGGSASGLSALSSFSGAMGAAAGAGGAVRMTGKIKKRK